MGSENWRPPVASVRLTFEYFVDADDEDMIEQAKEMIIEDMMDRDLDLANCIEVVPSTDPVGQRDLIPDYLLDCQVDRLVMRDVCPYCKLPMQDKMCHKCDEDWN